MSATEIARAKRLASINQHQRIWKQQCGKELNQMLYIWPSRWAFLVEECYKLDDVLAGKRPFSPFDFSRHYAAMRPTLPDLKPALPPIRTWPTARPPGEITSRPPRTANGWYGYHQLVNGRNIVKDYQDFCKADRISVSKHNMAKQLGWPQIFD